MDLGDRVIVDPNEIDTIVARQRYKESMEGVKEGYPYEEIFDGEDSLFQKYIDRKTKEYNERMEHFEEEMEERIRKKQLREGGISEEEVEEEYELEDLKSSSSANMNPVFVDDLKID